MTLKETIWIVCVNIKSDKQCSSAKLRNIDCFQCKDVFQEINKLLNKSECAMAVRNKCGVVLFICLFVFGFVLIS